MQAFDCSCAMAMPQWEKGSDRCDEQRVSVARSQRTRPDTAVIPLETLSFNCDRHDISGKLQIAANTNFYHCAVRRFTGM